MRDEPNVGLTCLVARSSDTIKGVGSDCGMVLVWFWYGFGMVLVWSSFEEDANKEASSNEYTG